MKKFIMGFVTGAILFGLAGVLAVQYDIIPNPYKIKVNGAEKPMEGYNINGYSYFKLRDIGEQVGFNVDFKEDTILIDENIIAPVQVQSNDISSGKLNITYEIIGGQEVIYAQDLDNEVDKRSNHTVPFGIKFANLIKDGDGTGNPSPYIELPIIRHNDKTYITRDTVENIIIPYITEHDGWRE